MQLNKLTDDQRLEARQAAKEYIKRLVGDAPTADQFANAEISNYPAWVSRAIGGMLIITAISSALPSFFRLFTAGRDYFLKGIDDPIQGAIVGFSTFMLAEFLVILSTIAASVLYEGRARWLFAVPVGMGLAMAIVGNWTVVKPHDLFSWLETLVPVGAVLFISLIGERLTLEAIQQRHASTKAYQQAMKDYQQATANPESHPQFMQAYANNLREAIIKVNLKGTGATARRDYMASMDSGQWKEAVRSEMQAENWYLYEGVIPAAPKPIEPVEVAPAAPFGNSAREQGAQENMLTGELVSGVPTKPIMSANGKH